MDATMVMTVMAWIWVLTGAAVVAMVGYVKMTQASDGLAYFVVLGTAAAAGLGSVVMGLGAMGWTEAAPWAFRIGAAGYLLLTLLRTQLSSATPPRLWAGAAYDIGLALLSTIAAFTTNDLVAGAASRSGAATRAPQARYVIDFVRTWEGIALGILAVATLFFLFLFVRMVERGAPPQVESHWGGIGGGVGGWRISSSLTYLLAAVTFGVLFAVFVSRLDNERPTQGSAAVRSTTPKPPPTRT